jgi:hypothetical protein
MTAPKETDYCLIVGVFRFLTTVNATANAVVTPIIIVVASNRPNSGIAGIVMVVPLIGVGEAVGSIVGVAVGSTVAVGSGVGVVVLVGSGDTVTVGSGVGDIVTSGVGEGETS